MADRNADTAPRVSVIMPTYNTAAYVQEAIDSVLAQDYPAKELIVVDDGSSDDTVERVAAYGHRVRLITQRNQGSAVARNRALEAARGEYIAFLDSDDVWLPGKLTTQIDHLESHPDIGLVYSRWQVWRPDANGAFPAPPDGAAAGDNGKLAGSPGIVEERSGWLYNRLLFSSLLHTITVVARRSLIDAVGAFDPALKRGQDYDYWIRASRVTPMHQLDRVLALYRVHGEGCARKWPYVNYEKLVVERAIGRWGLTGPDGERTPRSRIRRRLAEICFSFGYHHYWEGSARLALSAFLESARRRPTHVSSWRYLLMTAPRALRGSSRLPTQSATRA